MPLRGRCVILLVTMYMIAHCIEFTTKFEYHLRYAIGIFGLIVLRGQPVFARRKPSGHNCRISAGMLVELISGMEMWLKTTPYVYSLT